MSEIKYYTLKDLTEGDLQVIIRSIDLLPDYNLVFPEDTEEEQCYNELMIEDLKLHCQTLLGID